MMKYIIRKRFLFFIAKYGLSGYRRFTIRKRSDPIWRIGGNTTTVRQLLNISRQSRGRPEPSTIR
jgi:hypothetical protein